MKKSEAGKGDANRIRGKKARQQYEKNYMRIFGERCPRCNGYGHVMIPIDAKNCTPITCDMCEGKGKIYDLDILEDHYE